MFKEAILKNQNFIKELKIINKDYEFYDNLLIYKHILI
jgi:hypothetical protein